MGKLLEAQRSGDCWDIWPVKSRLLYLELSTTKKSMTSDSLDSGAGMSHTRQHRSGHDWVIQKVAF